MSRGEVRSASGVATTLRTRAGRAVVEDRAIRAAKPRPSCEPTDVVSQDQPSDTPRRIPYETAILDAARREFAMYDARLLRLGPDLSSSIVWNMLLDLLLSEEAGRQLSVMALSIGSRAPSATAIRYISVMEGKRIVTRFADPADRRRSFVRLTPDGRGIVLDLLTSR